MLRCIFWPVYIVSENIEVWADFFFYIAISKYSVYNYHAKNSHNYKQVFVYYPFGLIDSFVKIVYLIKKKVFWSLEMTLDE